MKRSFWSIIMFLFGNCFLNKPFYIIFFINLLCLFPCEVVGQTSNTSSPPSDNGSDFPTSGRYHFSPAMSVIFVIVVVVFFLIGCFSVFGRRCIESRNERSGLLETNQINRPPRRTGQGLESNVIDTFPTFLYSDVKTVKIGGTAALECAICLNEFKDDETLRLVPKCCHVFHPECIDTWLTSHVTCPFCRADLVPVPDETGTGTSNCNLFGRLNSDEDEETHTTRLSQKEDDMNSTSHQDVKWQFRRSHSTDNSLIHANNNYERFTLRLPENVQKKLTKPELRRAKSNLVFSSASSSKRGYRSSSVGPSLEIGNSHQQLNREDRWDFTITPPFLIRSSSLQAPVRGDQGNDVMARGSSSKPNKSPFEWLFSGSRRKDEAGERSSAKLMGNNIV